MHDLNELIPDDSGWELLEAKRINQNFDAQAEILVAHVQSQVR